MRTSFLPILAVCIALSACQTGADTKTPSPAANEAVIHGRAFYLERMMLPPDTVLDVQLINDRLADTPTAVIAKQRFTDLKGPPYEFALRYDPKRIESAMGYSLHASLSSGDGHLEFVTDTRVPVTPGSDAVVEFRLVRATR